MARPATRACRATSASPGRPSYMLGSPRLRHSRSELQATPGDKGSSRTGGLSRLSPPRERRFGRSTCGLFLRHSALQQEVARQSRYSFALPYKTFTCCGMKLSEILIVHLNNGLFWILFSITPRTCHRQTHLSSRFTRFHRNETR